MIILWSLKESLLSDIGGKMATITQTKIIKGFNKLPLSAKKELYDFLQFLLIKWNLLKEEDESEVLSMDDLNIIIEGELEFEKGETIGLEDYVKSRGISV